MIMLPETDLNYAEAMAKRLAEHLSHIAISCNGNSVNITASIGCCTVSGEHESIYEVLEHADQALLEAKRRGRNCVMSCGVQPVKGLY